ncbi:hypothetical protein [Streptomyces sp. NPDC101776]|uniref:hypothetical protein n=1 Tax=Streptomyces sp. NPDC101776 TaxID=3366146 RepID=UPI00382339CC
MRIRMLVQMPPGGLRNGQPWPDEGEETEIPTGEALHLVAAGIAEEIAEQSAAPSRRRPKKTTEGAG